MKAPDPEGPPRIDVSTEELETLLEQAKQEPLREEGYHKLKAAVRTLGYVTELLEKKEATLASLRELLCPASTEKTDKVLKQAGIDTGETKPSPESVPKKPKGAAAGHGRNGAAAYRGATKVPVPHASLKAGDLCPDAQCSGNVYVQRDPGVLVRIRGQAPLAATVYELEKLRCNLCGNVYTAEAPPEAGEKKYDESAASMIALLRYGSGVPWYRLRGLERSLGIPLPVVTQCEITAELAVRLQPAFEELKRQAAQGGSGAQRRYIHARVVAGSRCGHLAGANRSIHQRTGMALPRAPDRAVLHGMQTRRRESGRGTETAVSRPASAHSNV
jgi:transposase